MKYNLEGRIPVKNYTPKRNDFKLFIVLDDTFFCWAFWVGLPSADYPGQGLQTGHRQIQKQTGKLKNS